MSLIGMIPVSRRHQWFGSMASSQALTQTVFGTLAVMGRLGVLAALVTEDGERPFGPSSAGERRLELEVEADHLNEPRPTSKDVGFIGLNPVTVECKLTEKGVGTCSRPDLPSSDPDHCDGSYTRQSGRCERCPLTERGIRYWELVPLLFRIDPALDHFVCPLRADYQLVRNLLATCVSPEGEVLPHARVVLLYDERNPAFRPGGDGWNSYQRVRGMLHEPRMLQRTTWHRVTELLDGDAETRWLAAALDAKYGFLGRQGSQP
jgi:hypothetical protein